MSLYTLELRAKIVEAYLQQEIHTSTGPGLQSECAFCVGTHPLLAPYRELCTKATWCGQSGMY
jgi:hypothetical protein